jgi:hypothetical protein
MASDERKSSPPNPDERPTILDRLVKRGIESGIGAISRSEDTVRHLIDGVKLPKDAANVVLEQIDETKKGLYQVVAKEMRDFLQTTNFASDVKKILTGLAFEVKMEVRFKPTEPIEGESSGSVRPDVQAQAQLKSTRKRTKTASTADVPKDPNTDE